jgi:DegV family protein with EDD domain
MTHDIKQALITGTERLAVWSDVLDQINVFPVADGDTGRNLLLSLRPLTQALSNSADLLVKELLLSARGNSGNIAVQFFSGLLANGFPEQLPAAVARGTDLAWKAVNLPKEGTMLSFFRTLQTNLLNQPPTHSAMIDALYQTVWQSTAQLPCLQDAQVVDSGALGMFIFFDGFLCALQEKETDFADIAKLFGSKLQLAMNWQQESIEHGFCIDAVLEPNNVDPEFLDQLGDNLVTVSQSGYLKLHMHGKNQEHIHQQLEKMGSIISWAADDLSKQTENFQGQTLPVPSHGLHLMTDAAGSITRAEAKGLGITLLDSYINIKTHSVAETHMEPSRLYNLMRSGVKASTSQASDFEKYQHYTKVTSLYPKTLYLCVGSAFTGNYQTACRWKKEHDPDNRLYVIDSGAASGRLGLAVLAVARMAQKDVSESAIIDYAHQALKDCQEYIFLDKLSYLAAGGRLSKPGAFFGDMLRMKPVISPQPEGAKKVAVVRNEKEQISLALRLLEEQINPDLAYWIMLEYTDNQQKISQNIGRVIGQTFHNAEIMIRPVSLTAGTHMGPGTWGLAFLPKPKQEMA